MRRASIASSLFAELRSAFYIGRRGYREFVMFAELRSAFYSGVLQRRSTARRR